MISDKQKSAQQWQIAAAFFEQFYNLSIKQLPNEHAFIELETDVKKRVLKLYQNKSQSNTILDQPAIGLFNSIANQDLSGQTLDSYQLIKLIAHGGMSSVYRARKIAIEMQKDVAIKLIPANLQTAETTALFKRELKTLSLLHHPNIISMHHGDIAHSGTPYLVMELVESAQQIDEYFKKNNTSQQEIINQFIILCQVIDYAHQNGVIHQDIKPSNVLLDQHGHLLVLDFGVAALADAMPEHHAYTLSYAAPEQQIKTSLPKATFDTFAISSLLIKCLSQCNDHDSNWQSTALKQLKIDSDLSFILHKGIAINFDDRYQKASQLALDLSLWSQKLPINDLKNNPFYRIKKAITRHPFTSALLTLAVIAMLVGLIFYQQQYQIALSESKKASQIKNILIEAIDQSDPDISKGNDLTVKDMLEQVQIIHLQNPTTDLNTAKDLYMTLATAFNKLGDYESAEQNIREVLSIDPQYTTALLELTELKSIQKEAHEVGLLLAKLKTNLPFKEPESIIRYHLLSAKLHLINNAFQLAEEEFILANKLAMKVDNVNTKIKVLADHAEGLFETHQLQAATDKINNAIELSELYLGQAHSQTLELKAKKAEIYLSSSGNKVEQAIKIYQQIIPQQQTLLGDEHPIVSKSMFLNATGLRSLNRLPEARENATQALKIAQQQFGNNHIFTGRILMSLGGIYLAEGDTKKAIELAQKAVQNYEMHYGEEHPETLQYKTSYSAMLVKDEQFHTALEILLQIHPIQTTLLGSTHRGTLYVETTLAKVYAALGQLTESIAIGEQCLNNARLNDSQNISAVYCALNLENAYFLNQQYAEAAGLIAQYQDDPFIKNQPAISNQFKEHQQHIDQIQLKTQNK